MQRSELEAVVGKKKISQMRKCCAECVDICICFVFGYLFSVTYLTQQQPSKQMKLTVSEDAYCSASCAGNCQRDQLILYIQWNSEFVCVCDFMWNRWTRYEVAPCRRGSLL